jgi:hypothetical protein
MSSFLFIPGRVATFSQSSFTNQSFTISTNLQEPLCQTLKNFVKANWPNIIPNPIVSFNRIKFGTKWFDDLGAYQVHFLDSNIPERPISMSWQYTYISAIVDIHIWVRKNQLTRPAEIDDIKRSISYVIQSRKGDLPIVAPNSGGCWMRVLRELDMSESHDLMTIWHSVIQVEIKYYKARTTP